MADRAGLPFALMYKLIRSRSDLTLVPVCLSSGKKALFLRNLGVQSHLGAIVNFSSTQMEIATRRLNFPPSKLHHVMRSVEERFWHPADVPIEDAVCSVGWEASDYRTLVMAVSGLPLRARIAIGCEGMASLTMGKAEDGHSQPRPFESTGEVHPAAVPGMAGRDPPGGRTLVERSLWRGIPEPRPLIDVMREPNSRRARMAGARLSTADRLSPGPERRA